MASHMFLIVKLNKINPNRISSAFFSDWLTNTSLTPMLQIWHSQKLFLPLPNLPGLNTQPSNTLHLKISKKQDRLFAGMAKPLSTPRQKNSEAKPCRYHSSVSCRSSKFLCLSYQTRRVSCLSCSPWKMDFSQKGLSKPTQLPYAHTRVIVWDLTAEPLPLCKLFSCRLCTWSFVWSKSVVN